MADQKRWFKVWTSILTDLDFDSLDLADQGRWMRLGALIVQQGENGVLRVPGDGVALARLLRCEGAELRALLGRLPHVKCQIWDNGELTVSFLHWRKYQMDSTSYERLRRHRKHLNETVQDKDKDKDKDKDIKTDNSKKNYLPDDAVKPHLGIEWPQEDSWLRELLERQTFLNTSNGSLFEYAWWEDVAISINGIERPFIERQFAKMSAWLRENPNRKPTAKGTRRFLRTWLERGREQERRISNVKR